MITIKPALSECGNFNERSEIEHTLIAVRLFHYMIGMKMHPTLESMGITSFDDIDKFTLRYEGGFDVLKVYYRREKGSLLPKSKKFKFGRSTKTVLADGGQQTYRQVQEPSLVVLRAVEELGQIVGKAQETKITKDELVKELEHLERVMASKIAEIKDKIDSFQ